MKKYIVIWSVTLCLFFSSASFASAAKYEYDELNRLISVTYDNGQTIKYTYDPAGNVVSTTIKEKTEQPTDDQTPQQGGQNQAGGNGEQPSQRGEQKDNEAIEDKEYKENEEALSTRIEGEDDDKGSSLPNTATQIFNYILFGFILATIGILLYIKVRKKAEN